MIPNAVWENWATILEMVISMILGNQILSFYFGSVIITIVANLIYRLSSPKDDSQK